MLVTRINHANELLNMAVERCKYATFYRAVQKKLLGQISSILEEIMHSDFVYCLKLISKEFMLKQ